MSCLFLLLVFPAVLTQEDNRNWFAHIQDSFLTTPDIIVRNGYPVESHKVITKDGYVLTAHRIPCPKHSDLYCDQNSTRPPVLILPGLSLSSYYYVMQPNRSIGYGLADKGYDVWVANLRGQSLTDNLILSGTLGRKGWRFSTDEFGAYDVPELINLVLNVTGVKKLSVIGHSLGTNAAICMFADKTEYNDKVNVFIGWAPSLSIFPHTGVGGRVSEIPFGPTLTYGLAWLQGFGKMLPSGFSLRVIGVFFCNYFKIQKKFCRLFYFYLLGDDPNIKPQIIPEAINHLSSMSWPVFLQALQFTQNGRFAHYDYGKKKNLKKYGTEIPPIYNFGNIKVPTVFMYAPNDGVGSDKDPAYFKEHVTGLVDNYWVKNKNFSHVSFVLSNKIIDEINKPTYEYLERFSPVSVKKND